MDALTFISELAKALAWPVATVILVVALRREIRSLIPSLKKFKAGPVEAEFERELKELKAATDANPQLLPAPQQERLTQERQTTLELAQRSPRAAILESWLKVEEAVVRVIRRKGLEGQANSPLALIRVLDRERVLDPAEVSLYHELRALRNHAVHLQNFSPTPEAVVNYIELADRLLGALERAAQ